jgi:Thoeris protein ThsB, TIR-like domain
VGSISQQNPVRVFVSHVFEPADDYHRVFEYLESAKNFYYRNCSDPEVRTDGNSEAMKNELRKQISLAEIVIVPAGLYRRNQQWIDFQLNCAKGLDKPVIILETFGVKEKLPVQLEALGDEVIEWNERELADAIRRQARHEDTARWDVIDFKLD